MIVSVGSYRHWFNFSQDFKAGLLLKIYGKKDYSLIFTCLNLFFNKADEDAKLRTDFLRKILKMRDARRDWAEESGIPDTDQKRLEFIVEFRKWIASKMESKVSEMIADGKFEDLISISEGGMLLPE